MATFVLVHGAYQGSWVYSRLAQKLRAAGHQVYTPTLTGLGERSHLADRAINLDTHIQDIVNVFEFENIREAILCGHSYGGMVITGVAGEIADRISALFYLDAYAPTDGQSLIDITDPEITLAFLELAKANGGMLPPISSALFNVNEHDADWVDSLCVSQPLATFIQGVRSGVDNVAVARRIFLFAAKNGGNWFVSTYERLKNDPAWKVHSLSCGHAVMLDRTEELAELLLAEAVQ
ncbi:hypothetical protein NG99_15430 [Erwinia typographi]|uniref:AB hydrolase-1 domain-containing protein n=1 Tax=Erwinia typographi TaxID=371042 RepID=A0A0A3Z1W8_9GAMM|nr:alpha/beta hydrolase family protein [Erwinia typographi]KGT91759.1 hypothetical protein NG99_15430 [Erwinia typographi]